MARLDDWLGATAAVEVRPESDGFGVWVTNGETGAGWVGTRLARCATDADAELVAAALEDRRASLTW